MRSLRRGRWSSPRRSRSCSAGRAGRLLRKRLDARVVGTIGDAGLVGPKELVFYRGDAGLAGAGSGGGERIERFGQKGPDENLGVLLTLLVAIAVVVLLLPVAIFVAGAARFGSEDRDRRLAALRLVGADRGIGAPLVSGRTAQETPRMDRAELADFLRRRREALQPDDVGLSRGPRRRAPGLRREEVAALAGMSTDYYARLEQQRSPNPSEPMLVAIARGLRLTLDERDHLFRLAGHTPPSRRARSSYVSPALFRVLDRLRDTPALVFNDLAETLEQNDLAVALLGDQKRFEGLARSAFYRWFTDPLERARYPVADHDRLSGVQAAALRAALSVDTGDPRPREIVDRLLERSTEFRRVWADHRVAFRWDDVKTLVHPEVGEVTVDCQVLFTENQAQTLLILTASPGSENAEKLQLLSVIGAQKFTL